MKVKTISKPFDHEIQAELEPTCNSANGRMKWSTNLPPSTPFQNPLIILAYVDIDP